ncbi:uncharacterized protein LOC120584693 [Pteropus medius]|uniref:uncharacterized protein LOC120584693 n=1 Tax=Pteropus vampyrus TaxID=132908 RepID=UPI00196A907B|nr:uncharacterized protein LOC120584693 [Pteropus giganteus]
MSLLRLLDVSSCGWTMSCASVVRRWAVVHTAAVNVGAPVRLLHLLLTPGVKAETPRQPDCDPGRSAVSAAAQGSPCHASSSRPARAISQLPASALLLGAGWGPAAMLPVCICPDQEGRFCVVSGSGVPHAGRSCRAAGLRGVCLGSRGGPVTTQTFGLGPHLQLPPAHEGTQGERSRGWGVLLPGEPIGASAPRFHWVLSCGRLCLARTTAPGSRQATVNILHGPRGRWAGVPASQPWVRQLHGQFREVGSLRSVRLTPLPTRFPVPSVARTPALPIVTVFPSRPWDVNCEVAELREFASLLPLRD